MKKSLYRTMMDEASTKALVIGIVIELVLAVPLVVAVVYTV